MFAVSIPDLFFYNPLLNLVEFGLVFGTFLLVNTMYAPVLKPDARFFHKEHVYEYLKAAWSGHEALWRVFWPFPVIVLLIYAYIDYRTDHITFTIASWRTVHGMLALPFVWWLVSVWQCSANTGYRACSVLARSTALFFVFIACLRVLTSFEYPEELFDCKLLILQYGDC